MSHYDQTDYDRQFNKLRENIERDLLRDDLAKQHRSAKEDGIAIDTLIQSMMAKTAHLRVLDGVWAAHDEAEARVAARAMRLVQIAQTPAQEPVKLRPARQSVEAIAEHFEGVERRRAGGRS